MGLWKGLNGLPKCSFGFSSTIDLNLQTLFFYKQKWMVVIGLDKINLSSCYTNHLLVNTRGFFSTIQPSIWKLYDQWKASHTNKWNMSYILQLTKCINFYLEKKEEDDKKEDEVATMVEIEDLPHTSTPQQPKYVFLQLT